ncbi:MAG: hypothetical protein KDM64_08910 [Verrucomicrobiae bacterium]|nr:hypothetical protein [Verrucomicrobiae bacterium]
MNQRNRLLSTFLVALASGGTAFAGDAKQVVDTMVEADKASICDVFDYATLYENKENPILQKFALSGRLQADAAFFDGGDKDFEELTWRRFRSGFKAKILNSFTLHSEGEFDLNEGDPFYERLTDTYLAWEVNDELEFKFGKQSAPFTMDGATSSKELIRPERSVLAENLWFPTEYFTGVAAKGKMDKWVYTVGYFSSDGGNEFGDFEAGFFGLVSIGYDFGETFGLDKALIRADYVNNDIDDGGNVGTRSLSQVGSLNGTFEKGPWGLRTDIAAGEGHGHQSDVFALAIMPYYNITEKVQLVASYNYVSSSAANGVRLDRYENRTVSGRVDEVHEFFAGVNYYVCGHKLKWQNGVEYTTASDVANDGGAYDGWGFTSAIRLSW